MTTDRLPEYIAGPEAMLFSSFEYLLLFLPLTVVIYFWLHRRTHSIYAHVWLTTASLAFYGWWSLSYLWLIGGSILFNYTAARLLGQLRGRYALYLLATFIIINLGLLGYYKYADFFISNWHQISGTPMTSLHLALPLGISFFTFTQIAFLVDVYRGSAREYNFVHYCLFITYFPHLIAGPILHHSEMMPQFTSVQARTVNWQNIHTGICMLSIGLFKKVILADSLAPTVNEGFNSIELLPFHQAWLTSLSYSLQLYFDFSGYTDMAIGSALLCNIRLPTNFNSPYQATDIQDFWRRWHITLSRWLRDYLYIPLGGNRHGLVHGYSALIMTFLLGGLWHGASWTFVFWGALHGAASVIHKSWQTTGWKLPAFPSWLLTFLFINSAWVFFRADTFSGALGILESMAGLHGFAPSADLLAIIENVFTVNTWNPFLDGWWGRRLLLVCFSMLIALLLPNSSVFAEKSLLSLNKSVSAVLLGIFSGSVIFYTLFMIAGINSFIYFYF